MAPAHGHAGPQAQGRPLLRPYGHAYAIRETLDLLLRTFPLRTCSDNKFRRHERLGRPCLLFHIEKCSGPCVGEVDHETYQRLVDELLDFLDGDTDTIVRRLEAADAEAADGLEYERAARLRDRLTSVRKAIERQQMVADRNEDLDVVGIAEDDLEAAVQVFFVRKGRVVGRKGFVVDKVEDLAARASWSATCSRASTTTPPLGVPRTVLVPSEPDDPELYAEWLASCAAGGSTSGCPSGGQARAAGRRSPATPPRSSPATACAGPATTTPGPRRSTSCRTPSACPRPRCASSATTWPHPGHRLRRLDGGDGGRAAQEVRVPPLQGQGCAGNDDFAAMEEVLTRRLSAYLDERALPVSERAGRFAYPPQLLLVDGGKGQLAVAVRVLEDLGLDDEIPVASLAKRFEEVYVPGQADPVRIPAGSEALYLLQRIRDEAHRFAITYHRQLRGKRMTKSVLDDIKGLGPTRRKRLTKELGGVAGVRKASLDDLRALSWLPDDVADAVYDKVHGRAPGPAGGERASAMGQCRDRPGPIAPRPRRPRPRWERHAAWWQPSSPRAPTSSTRSRSCPWPPATWPGARVLDLGCGEGQVARLAAAAGARRVVGVEPAWAQIGEAATGRRAGYVPGRGEALPFPDGLRRRGDLPGARAHRRPRRRPRRGGPGAASRAAGSCCSPTTRCSRRRAAGGSTTRCSTRPSSTGGWGSTSPRS